MTSYERIVDRVCKRTCDRFCFFDQKIAVEKLTGLKLLAERLQDSSSSGSNNKDKNNATNYVSSMDKFACQLCSFDFSDADAMREHFKSELHLYKMNLSLGKSYSSEDSTVRSSEARDSPSSTTSNLSESVGSVTNVTSDTCPSLGASSHKQMVYFRSRDGEIIGIHRCILFSRKTIPTSMDELLSNVARIRQSRRWAVLLYSGGKFAGGIFDGVNEVVHKTLHHYTVRAKQGGGQSAYDASSSGMGGAKSAGASLRRHGEVAIRTEISQLLHGRWRSQLQACQFILVWSPKVHRNIFFNPPPTMPGESDQSYSTNSTGAQNDPANSSCPGPDRLATAACQVGLGMTADDVRVRRIPCRTNEITYSHVKELHKEMSSFYVYDSHANFAFLSQSGRKQLRSLSESGDDTLLETRSGRIVYGPLSLLDPKPEKLTNSSLSVSESDITMTTTEDDTETEPEEEGDDEKPNLKLNDGGNDSATLALDKAGARLSSTNTTTRPELGSEKLQPTNEKSLQEQIDELYSLYHNWHRRVRVAIASGDQVVLRSLLPEICPPTSTQSNANESPSSACSTAVETCLTRSPGSQTPSVEHCSILMNYPLADGRTLLHVAVEFQQEPEVVSLLLQSGCDPTFKDTEGKTPYILAVSLRKKQLCTVFRRFRFFHPDLYDYEKAQIPAPIDPTAELQKTERERERQRKQRQRQKERKANEKVKLQKEKEEAEEKARFIALPDREKRALMAERRLLATQATNGTTSTVFSRCFQCACDISGKVPFTYMEYNFCTPACLKAHRLKTPRPS